MNRVLDRIESLLTGIPPSVRCPECGTCVITETEPRAGWPWDWHVCPQCGWESEGWPGYTNAT